MFKLAFLLAPLYLSSAALAGEGKLQTTQITEVDAYTEYDIEGVTGEYKFGGIRDTPKGPAKLVLDDEGEVFYHRLRWQQPLPRQPCAPAHVPQWLSP